MTPDHPDREAAIDRLHGTDDGSGSRRWCYACLRWVRLVDWDAHENHGPDRPGPEDADVDDEGATHPDHMDMPVTTGLLERLLDAHPNYRAIQHTHEPSHNQMVLLEIPPDGGDRFVPGAAGEFVTWVSNLPADPSRDADDDERYVCVPCQDTQPGVAGELVVPGGTGGVVWCPWCGDQMERPYDPTE